MCRYRGFLLPAVLIAIGLLFLAYNLGWFSADAFIRLAAFWPVLLVIVGVQIVLNHTLDRRTAAAAGSAITVILLAGAVAYAAFGPEQPLGTQHTETSEPLNGLASGTLSLDISANSVEVQEAALGGDMYRARIDYPGGQSAPQISLDRSNGTVTIETGSGSFFPFIQRARSRLVVELNDRIPWAVELSGGASNIRLRVSELQLTRLEVSGGARSVDASLPAPKGTVPIDVSGGASSISIRAPKGTAWRVQISGGASSVDIDGTSFGSLFQATSKQSDGYDRATDRYTIDISGGASHISFTTR